MRAGSAARASRRCSWGPPGSCGDTRATTNFHLVDLLPFFGATPAAGNVVEDGNRITAGPVTGSIEIALRLVQDLFGDDVARETELHIEYAPTPLFGTGSPALAGPELVARARAHTAAMGAPFPGIAERAARRLGVAVPVGA